MRWINSILIILLLSAGCAAPDKSLPSLGYEKTRRIVVVGENVDPNIAYYYQKKYDALVWFTSYKGRFANNVDHLLETGLAKSMAMRGLIKELKSINYSFGQWEIVIPGIAEDYFLDTLKNMEDGSLSKARGIVVLIDSKGNKDIEVQVNRVTSGSFFVSYEFQK